MPATKSSEQPPARRTNVLAVVALCCALLGVVTCLPAPIGAVLGHVARRHARERGEHGAGMALAAIVVGWTGFALMVAVVATYIGLVFYSVEHPDGFFDGGDGGSWGGGWDVIRLAG
jgi:hypothetical protein